MSAPVAALLGERLHLQHGPIDLIIDVDAEKREEAFAVAAAKFDGLLEGLVAELPLLRTALTPDAIPPQGAVARRTHDAALPYCGSMFITPMVAVAGAVADEVLAAMCATVPLRRAYVNNGGDIAVHLAQGEVLSTAIADHTGGELGRVCVHDHIGGLATSGVHGRSHSFGIADSVTVLARDAATADVAATVIANAVDLPCHPRIKRVPANSLQPDSDLGERQVVVEVPRLAEEEVGEALEAGRARAENILCGGLIFGATLTLQGRHVVVGSEERSLSNA